MILASCRINVSGEQKPGCGGILKDSIPMVRMDPAFYNTAYCPNTSFTPPVKVLPSEAVHCGAIKSLSVSLLPTRRL